MGLAKLTALFSLPHETQKKPQQMQRGTMLVAQIYEITPKNKVFATIYR